MMKIKWQALIWFVILFVATYSFLASSLELELDEDTEIKIENVDAAFLEKMNHTMVSRGCHISAPFGKFNCNKGSFFENSDLAPNTEICAWMFKFQTECPVINKEGL